MATKNAAAGNKRKSGPGGKGKSEGKVKKARFEPKPQPEATEESDDFESFSDSDDGGAKLEKTPSSKSGSKNADKAPKDKTFERGNWPTGNELAAISNSEQEKLLASPMPSRSS